MSKTMQYFKYDAEDNAAINTFRKTCRHEGLELKVSRLAAIALKELYDTHGRATVTTQSAWVLLRRGAIVVRDGEGEEGYRVTEIGFHLLCLAEADGLFDERGV